jgi:hypothetical protein
MGAAFVAVSFGLWPERGTSVALLTAAAIALAAALVSSLRIVHHPNQS